jgi:hypothetical protein
MLCISPLARGRATARSPLPVLMFELLAGLRRRLLLLGPFPAVNSRTEPAAVGALAPVLDLGSPMLEAAL